MTSKKLHWFEVADAVTYVRRFLVEAANAEQAIDLVSANPSSFPVIEDQTDNSPYEAKRISKRDVTLFRDECDDPIATPAAAGDDGDGIKRDPETWEALPETRQRMNRKKETKQ